METTLKYFLGLNPAGQIKFLKDDGHEAYSRLGKEGKVDFIKNALKTDLSSKVTASALKILRYLGYEDKYFYRHFLYHVDSSVANAARKAINECSSKKDSAVIRLEKILREGKTDDRVLIAENLIKSTGKVNESVIITMLGLDDQRVRDTLIRGISPHHQLDENKLLEAVKGGAVWHVRAALVAILGNRKSRGLLDIIDLLLKDPNIDVRLQLIDALTKIGGPEVTEPLQTLAQDPLVTVRRKAQKILISSINSTD